MGVEWNVQTVPACHHIEESAGCAVMLSQESLSLSEIY